MKKSISIILTLILTLCIFAPIQALAATTVTIGGYEFLVSDDYDEINNIESSNDSVATVVKYSGYYDDAYYIYGVSSGSAVITYYQDETKHTVSVKVVKPTLSSSFKTINIDTQYNYNYGYDEYDEYLPPDFYVYYNALSGLKVSSSNKSVATAKMENYSLDEWLDNEIDEDNYYIKNGKDIHYLLVYPKKQGKTTFTIFDNIGNKVKINVNVKDGKTLNKLKKSSFKSLKYGDTVLKGETLDNASVKLKISGKTYKTKADSNGNYKFKNVKICKIGTEFKITFTSKGISYTKKGKVKKPKTPYLWHYYYYKNQKKFHGYVKNVHKGDKVKITIGKKTYTKTIKKNASGKTKIKYSFKVTPNGNYGSKIKLKVVNKYNQTLRSYTSKIYYSKNLKKGMTMKQAKCVPGWEYPDEKHYYDYGTYWWYDDDDDGYAGDSYLYFNTKNKLESWYFES
ncbi:MAG: hypothetical protein IJR70_04780 [Eubacterium sp.]|nr:hypothetical protein [Eubacterium sp.]